MPCRPGLLAADPFAARSIIETAASIEPFEWRRGATDRALARTYPDRGPVLRAC